MQNPSGKSESPDGIPALSVVAGEIGWGLTARAAELHCQLNAQPCLVSHTKGTDGKECTLSYVLTQTRLKTLTSKSLCLSPSQSPPTGTSFHEHTWGSCLSC